MMKLFRKLHLWLSVPFGIIVTLICFSGAMLIFEPEVTRSVNRDVYYVSSTHDNPLPMADLMETVKATLPDTVTITGVTVFSDSTRTYQVNLSKPRRASLFIDQYTGRITGRYERLGFFSTMFRLHRWLLDSANPHGDGLKTGKLLVGISTIIFVIALITGVIIWWPRARKNLRKSLTIPLSRGTRGFWKGLHVAGGMYALLFVLAMSLTGLTYSFGWYRTAFYAVCGVEHTPRNFTQATQAKAGGEDRGEHRGNREENRGQGRGEGHREGRDDRGRGHDRGHHRSEFSRWQQVLERLRELNPDAPQITIAPESATVTLGTTGNGRAADRYTFDRRTGQVSLQSAYTDSTEADRLRGWIYAIHTGSLGGLTTRVLWLLGALLGATLPLTGYYIWIRHLLGKGKDKHHH